MKSKKLSAVISAICALTMTASIPTSFISAEGDSYDMTVSVNLAGEKKSISPYIYGVNEFNGTNQFKNVTVNAAREGGNRFTGYNWETNYSNAGNDWLHSSDSYFGTPADGAAAAPRKFSETCNQNDISYKLATLQMSGYVSADMDGTVTEDQTAPSSRWKEVRFRKDGDLSLEPDTSDDYVYMDEYVNYLVKTLGDSTTKTGIQAYSLDNEPALWNDSHPRLHKEEVSSKELISKSIELASVVKEIDPNAEVFGGVFWGMLPCIQAGESENYQDPDWQAVKSNYTWYLDYYLDQMAQAEKTNGKRLLDVIDVHYYAQDCATDDAKLQAPRSLYDPDYKENSWVQQWFGSYFPFLPNIQKSIDTYYPGTKISVSEYNVADIANETTTGKSVISGIAEAETLGCFADNNVYFATYWGTLSECPYVASAINLYTNYDGKGASFGDTLVEAKTQDLSQAAAYAAVHGDDDSVVNVVVSNKDKEKSEKAQISLSGTDKNYKSAVVYAITQDNSDIHIIDVQNDLSGDVITVELPPLSVAQVVLSTENSDQEIYVAPSIDKKEITYQFADLEKNADGNYIIPIEDKNALKKAVINTTASCSSDAGWYCGGGGLCFSQLKDASGTVFWGQKSFTYQGGNYDSTIVFDGSFTNADSEEVNAEIGDDAIEFQDWWKASANDENGADVSVTYNSITLYYEYENETPSEPSSEPTSEPSETSVHYGDVNEDGTVDVTDIILLNKAIYNKADLSDQGLKNADINQDGKPDATDSLNIMKLIIKLISAEELPLK